jgi:hypothetical protein
MVQFSVQEDLVWMNVPIISPVAYAYIDFLQIKRNLGQNPYV